MKSMSVMVATGSPDPFTSTVQAHTTGFKFGETIQTCLMVQMELVTLFDLLECLAKCPK